LVSWAWLGRKNTLQPTETSLGARFNNDIETYVLSNGIVIVVRNKEHKCL